MARQTDRIEAAFGRAREAGRACFISYICAGDPDRKTSLAVCRCLVEEGTDILELGVPFSDPLADGLTNQLAAERALAAGMDQEQVFGLVESIREFAPEVPIVFYTYYNLVHACGVREYVARAARAGVDALLTLDLPPEEAGELEAACAEHGMGTVFIVAPTTPKERLELIASHATSFLYYVSREGVTGEQDSMAGDLAEKVGLIRAATELPVVVGFGISRQEHVREVAQLADGAVVGSALVNCIARAPGQPEEIVKSLREKMRSLTPGLVRESGD